MTEVNTIAQATAWLLQNGGKPMDLLKVQKLLYLADRECMDQTGFPISNDTYCHRQYGPVLAETLDLMEGKVSKDEWSQWVASDETNKLVPVQPDTDRKAYDHLSDFEIDIL